LKCECSPADPQSENCDPVNQRIERLVNDYEEKVLRRVNVEYRRKTRWSDRLADKIAAFGGSWRFIIIFSLILAFWIVWNTLSFTRHFDNPPYILLNLVLSLIAAFQAPVIMMSQNRHAEQDKHEAIIDFAINYKSEQEIDDIQSHLHRLEADMREIKDMLRGIKAGSEKE